MSLEEKRRALRRSAHQHLLDSRSCADFWLPHYSTFLKKILSWEVQTLDAVADETRFAHAM
jgi:hypothetical protein